MSNKLKKIIKKKECKLEKSKKIELTKRQKFIEKFSLKHSKFLDG